MNSFLYNDKRINTSLFLLPNLKILGGLTSVRQQLNTFTRYYGEELPNPVYKPNFYSPIKKLSNYKKFDKNNHFLTHIGKNISLKKKHKKGISPFYFSQTSTRELKEVNKEKKEKNKTKIDIINKSNEPITINNPIILLKNIKTSKTKKRHRILGTEKTSFEKGLNIVNLNFPYRKTTISNSFTELFLYKKQNKDKNIKIKYKNIERIHSRFLQTLFEIAK